MKHHLRAVLYLAAGAVIWFAEDALFSTAFGFNLGQVVVVTIYFVGLFVAAVWLALRTSRRLRAQSGGFDVLGSRLVTYAPIVVVVVGSFAALPVLMLVLILGHVF